ncbi:hypothetical protein [Aromatoleum diolicum]|nr:hypothetical protein [Aromatoleum diolicum]
MQSTVVVDHDTKRRKAVLEALFGNLHMATRWSRCRALSVSLLTE